MAILLGGVDPPCSRLGYGALGRGERDRVGLQALAVGGGVDAEVQVREGGVAGVAGEGDRLAGGDPVADLDEHAVGLRWWYSPIVPSAWAMET